MSDDDKNARDKARTDRLKEIGTLLYGERFGGQLHKALDIPQATMAKLMLGQRRVTGDLEMKLVALLETQTKDLIKRAGMASHLAAQLRTDLGIKPSVTVSSTMPVVGGIEPLAEPELDDDGPNFEA